MLHPSHGILLAQVVPICFSEEDSSHFQKVPEENFPVKGRNTAKDQTFNLQAF